MGRGGFENFDGKECRGVGPVAQLPIERISPAIPNPHGRFGAGVEIPKPDIDDPAREPGDGGGNKTIDKAAAPELSVHVVPPAVDAARSQQRAGEFLTGFDLLDRAC